MRRESVEAALAAYRGFEECLLEELRWRDAGRTLELVFGYIWSDESEPRVLDSPRPVVIRLTDATAVRIDSPLTPVMLQHRDKLDWGIKEVAQVRLAGPSDSSPGISAAGDTLHLVVVWEGPGRIDILFRGLDAEQAPIEPPIGDSLE